MVRFNEVIAQGAVLRLEVERARFAEESAVVLLEYLFRSPNQPCISLPLEMSHEDLLAFNR